MIELLAGAELIGAVFCHVLAGGGGGGECKLLSGSLAVCNRLTDCCYGLASTQNPPGNGVLLL